MRERVLRADGRDFDVDDEFDGEERSRVRALLNGMFDVMRRHPVDTFAGLVAAGGVVTILVNALFLQSGPHPAPIFANTPPQPQIVSQSLTAADKALPLARPVEPPAPAPVRPRAELIADIQRELSRRGYYDGAPDGIYGPKTDAAIRDFEHGASLRPSSEPSEALLQTIRQSPPKAKPAGPTPRKNDPIASLLNGNPRVMAVQRALSSYGYGQIKPTGVYDPETRAAIERFERERRLPVTGQISERLARELSSLTGRPLE